MSKGFYIQCVIKENANAPGSSVEAFKVYQEVFEKLPELTTGVKEIKVIQEQLPQAVKETKANPLYEAKTIREIFEASGAVVEESLNLKIDISSNRNSNKSPKLEESKKLKI